MLCATSTNGSWTVAASPNTVNAGDPITLKIAVSGRGNLDNLKLPDVNWPDFKVYQPNSSVASDDPLGPGELAGAHLVEVAGAQELVGGEGERGVELGALGERLPRGRRRAPRLGDPPRNRLCPRYAHMRQELRQRRIDSYGVAPEEAERLIEKLEILWPLDQDGVERPVQLVTLDDVHGGRGGEGVESARRPEPQAGAAQKAGEVDDVVGQL